MCIVKALVKALTSIRFNKKQQEDMKKDSGLNILVVL